MDDLKKFSWVILGGLVAGTITRKIYENVIGFPNIVGSSLIDFDSIILGVPFILIWILILAANEKNSRIKDKALARRIIGSRSGIKAFSHWVYFFFQLHVRSLWNSLILYLFVAAIIYVLTGRIWHAASWVFVATSFSLPGDTIGAGGVSSLEAFSSILGATEDREQLPIILIILSLIYTIINFGAINQSFGGGRPRSVIVTLANPEADSGLTDIIHNKSVNLIFRSGEYLAFRKDGNQEIFVLRSGEIRAIRARAEFH